MADHAGKVIQCRSQDSQLGWPKYALHAGGCQRQFNREESLLRRGHDLKGFLHRL